MRNERCELSTKMEQIDYQIGGLHQRQLASLFSGSGARLLSELLSKEVAAVPCRSLCLLRRARAPGPVS